MLASLNTMTRLIGATFLISLVPGGVPSAQGAELVVISGGAVKSPLTEVIAAFEKATAQKVKVDYAPMGTLTKRLDGGEKADVVVVTQDIIADVQKRGFVDANTSTPLGGIGIGVAVHQNAPAPDISTPDAFKKALLDAKSIVYINPKTGTSGKHLAQVFAQLGIADAVNAKAKLLDGGYVVEPVGRGEIELGLHQISEILPVPGVKLIGPLPAPLQKLTVYVASVGSGSTQPEAAKRFIAHAISAQSQATFATKGFTATP